MHQQRGVTFDVFFSASLLKERLKDMIASFTCTCACPSVFRTPTQAFCLSSSFRVVVQIMLSNVCTTQQAALEQ